MLKNVKEIIRNTAYTAVRLAESALKNATGKKKKEMAIQFIVSKIPVMQPFKSILVVFLSKFIDKAVEQAVIYIKNER